MRASVRGSLAVVTAVLVAGCSSAAESAVTQSLPPPDPTSQVGTSPSAGGGPPMAQAAGRATAILVQPIHDAQVVRGDDGMDHVEYELLVISVFSEPLTVTSVDVLGPAGEQLLRIQGDMLSAGTQSLFDKTPSAVVPASGAVSVDVDLIVAPGAAPDRLTHRVSYAFDKGSAGIVMFDGLEVTGTEVTVDKSPAVVIAPPLAGDGWFVSSACCAPNVHRDLRIAADGNRIATAETFAVDWARTKGDRLYAGDGTTNELHYAFGAEILAVADGTVISTQDGMAETTPYQDMIPTRQSDFGGNQIMLQIGPHVFVWYAHLQPGSILVAPGDVVDSGTPLAALGNSGPSQGPHLHLGVLDQPNPFIGKSLPFLLDSFTQVATVDMATSEADHLIVSPVGTPMTNAYPLFGSIQDYR